MADESGDVEMGGYVDDDIELDDINVDEELESLDTANTSTGKLSSARPTTLANAGMNARRLPGAVSGSSAAMPGDLYLRPANRLKRSVVLAKFLAPDNPTLVGVNRLRLYRHGEGTLKGRERGLKKHREQLAYYNSYVGKRRTIQKHNVGTQNIPDRNKKSWYMEVTPSNTQFVEPPRVAPDSREEDKYAEGVEAYNSTYEGGSTSAKYALLVANADGKHVDVVPVGDQAWFRFRSIRSTFAPTAMCTIEDTTSKAEDKAKAEAEEEDASRKAERLMRRKTGGKLFERFKERTALATERRSGAIGGYNFHAEERQGIVPVGLRRKFNANVERVRNQKGESECVAEFDNDDVDTAGADDEKREEPGTKKNTMKSAQRIKRENAERERLIRDESLPSNIFNDNSIDNSDGDAADSGSEAEVMPLHALSAAIARAKSRSPSPPPPVRMERPKGEVTKELLPSAGKLIDETHVRAVIIALTTERGKAKTQLKELVAQFDELRKKSDAQQKALTKAVKAIGEISKVSEAGKPVYYVALKR